jgi:formylglycine-generating enzyme required for sulfatase activity
MKKLFICLTLCVSANICLANNIKVLNATLEARDTVNKVRFVTFDLSWDNSWRCDLEGQGNAEPLNWDAAWVFIKYVRYGQGYLTATLASDSSKHVSPLGCKIKPAGDGKGAFIYRSQNGTGSVNFQTIKLRWDYGLDGAAVGTTLADSIVGFQVIAVEMVYVPGGDFFVGDPAGPGGPNNCFYTYGDNGTYRIGSEDSISYGKTTGKLYSNWSTSIDNKGIPASFPKGYKAFYVMKYEGTNQQYVDFLNSISPTQQDARDDNIIADMAPSSRGGITKSGITFITSHPDRVVFNPTFRDAIAYFDWSGLRIMTEFEYEKAARGRYLPVMNEYAWGSPQINNIVTAKRMVYGSGTGVYENGSETVHDSVNAHLNFPSPLYKQDNTTSIGTGPLRAGIFAKANTTRYWSGASYNGAMELTGNSNELVLNIYEANYFGFTSYNGSHGDGILAPNGDCNIPTLTLDQLYYGVRGGSWSSDINTGKIAYRSAHFWWNNPANLAYGTTLISYLSIRGIRTAP